MQTGNNAPFIGAGGDVHIATQRGEIAIAALRPGDEAAAIGLTGFVRIAAAGPHERAMPAIRLARDAIAAGEPRRDCVLAADTSIVLLQEDGSPLLVRAGALVNAASIARAPDAADGLWHMTLDRSRRSVAGLAELVLLDGLRVATGAQIDIPATKPGQLQAIRTRLRARAQALGAVPAAHQDVHLLADGVRLDAARRRDGAWTFALPADIGELIVCSASGVPSEMDVTSDDDRMLGIGVGRLTLDGARIDLEDARLASGWYGVERDGDTAWRWTDGHATLRVAGPGTLEVAIVRVMEIWATAATAEALPAEAPDQAPPDEAPLSDEAPAAAEPGLAA